MIPQTLNFAHTVARAAPPNALSIVGVMTVGGSAQAAGRQEPRKANICPHCTSGWRTPTQSEVDIINAKQHLCNICREAELGTAPTASGPRPIATERLDILSAVIQDLTARVERLEAFLVRLQPAPGLAGQVGKGKPEFV